MANNAKEQVLAFLKANATEWFPSGQLQRMTFKNRRGTTATPRSIVRRLEELENERMVAVVYDGTNARYRYIPEKLRQKYKCTHERAHKYSNDRWLS